MPILNKISFLVPKCDTKASNNQIQKLINTYGNCELNECDVIVALGGDGFMLEALHTAKTFSKPVYGMNRGTIGFLMNKFSSQNLLERINKAEETIIHPLQMRAEKVDGSIEEALAINEVSNFGFFFPRKYPIPTTKKTGNKTSKSLKYISIFKVILLK